ncbi:MAG: polysaccharide biosynthesis tyrosine autokinase [Deltaproteobacteria bacterium]|nr:polysaccharide biosynthesis tyrosine autokinase [Deltaproteobacteria bacterium]
MGTIFDALAKSKEEHIESSSTNEEGTILSDQHQKIVKPSNIAGSFCGNNIDTNLVTLINPNSCESEQFKMLRTNLLFPISGKPPRTIMVTSAVPGEGKSFVAANLAVSIAQGINEHVLLMDCDMRMPTIHRSFGFGNVHGLSDYLSNGSFLSSSLLKTKVEKLTILPGGKPQHNPAELLSSEKMSKLLAEVKTRYPDRYIVIDSPPPQLTAETGAIARQVDGIILVVRFGSTRRELVEDTLEKLDKEKIVGVIVNRFDIQSMNYGYGRYGKYGKYYA